MNKNKHEGLGIYKFIPRILISTYAYKEILIKQVKTIA